MKEEVPIRSERSHRAQAGFTLVELLVVIALTGILLTLGASAARHFWLVRSLYGAQDEVLTQLRRLQQRALTESHPLVYGARFRPGSSRWALVRYDPNGGGQGVATCREVGVGRFDAGVAVSSAPGATSFSELTPFTSTCREQISGATGDEFVFFFPRGNATAGKVTLYLEPIARSREVNVAGLTGRVTKQ